MPERARLSDARRMGAARGDLAVVAAQRGELAGRFRSVPGIFVEINAPLAESELVRINVADEDRAAERARVVARGRRGPRRVRFHFNPTNDAWVRDHGPIYVVRDGGDATRAIIDWGYNAWGDKYPPTTWTTGAGAHRRAELSDSGFTPGIVMEGGSIDVNGRGTLVTTEACLLNPNRNPHLNRERDRGGLARLPRRAEHPLARRRDRRRRHRRARRRPRRGSSPPTRSSPRVEDDPRTRITSRCSENYERSCRMTDQDGQAAASRDAADAGAGRTSTASACRRATPTSTSPTNDPRIRALHPFSQDLFPDRSVVGIDCTHLVWGLGAIHCRHAAAAGGLKLEPDDTDVTAVTRVIRADPCTPPIRVLPPCPDSSSYQAARVGYHRRALGHLQATLAECGHRPRWGGCCSALTRR